MAKKKKSDKMSLKEVAEVVEMEGLGYAVMDYMSGDSIADKHLADLWDDAKMMLKSIDNYLASKVPDYNQE